MNNINPSNSNAKNKINPYDVPPPNEENFVDKVPPEIFQKISSYLSAEDIESSEAVNPKWNEASLYPLKNENHHHLAKLIHLLLKHLPEGVDKHLKDKLIELEKDDKILDAISIKQIKSLSHKTIECVVEILKDLSDLEITSLESKVIPVPEPFKDVFKLARIYIDLKRDLSDDKLAECVDVLLKAGFLDKALETSNKISNKDLKSDQLIAIIMLTQESRSYLKALEIIYNPPMDFLPEEKKVFIDTGLAALSYSLNRKNAFQIGLEVLAKIQDPGQKAMALTNTMDDFLHLKEYAGLLKVLEMIGDHFSNHPECFYPEASFNEMLQNLSDKLAMKEPSLSVEILNLQRS